MVYAAASASVWWGSSATVRVDPMEKEKALRRASELVAASRPVMVILFRVVLACVVMVAFLALPDLAARLVFWLAGWGQVSE